MFFSLWSSPRFWRKRYVETGEKAFQGWKGNELLSNSSQVAVAIVGSTTPSGKQLPQEKFQQLEHVLKNCLCFGGANVFIAPVELGFKKEAQELAHFHYVIAEASEVVDILTSIQACNWIISADWNKEYKIGETSVYCGYLEACCWDKFRD